MHHTSISAVSDFLDDTASASELMGPTKSSDTDGDQEERLYACPFIKAFPTVWIDNSKCVGFRTDKLKNNLLRHHVLDFHRKQNNRYHAENVHRVDPQVFSEISKINRGSKCDDHQIWMRVFDTITGTPTDSSALQDPYWTITWLHETLGTMIRSIDESVAPSGERYQNHTANLSEVRMKVQSVEDTLAIAFEAFANTMKDVKSQLQHVNIDLKKLDVTRPLNQSSFESEQIGDTQSTQAAGTIFSDDPEMSALAFEVDATTEPVLSSAGDPPPRFNNTTVDPSMVPMGVHDPTQPWLRAGPYASYNSSNQWWGSTMPPSKRARTHTECTSNQTKSTMTPSSSSVQNSPYY